MRDVTDNVTGELPGVEHKRGRGRPRKAHAMTNAERQAAFRARRKALQPVDAKSVTKRMTVTEMLSDVDAYDDCRVEVDALREELARLPMIVPKQGGWSWWICRSVLIARFAFISRRRGGVKVLSVSWRR